MNKIRNLFARFSFVGVLAALASTPAWAFVSVTINETTGVTALNLSAISTAIVAIATSWAGVLALLAGVSLLVMYLARRGK